MPSSSLQAPTAAPLAQPLTPLTLLTTLRNTLASVTLSHLAATTISADSKMLLVEYAAGLTPAKAVEGRLLQQLKRQEGEKFTLQLVLLVVRQLVDSIRVPNKLDGPEILEVAEELVHRYQCDSLEDLILAFKQARFGGYTFYNKIDQNDILRIVEQYMDTKSRLFEEGHRDQKARGISQDYSVVAQVGKLAPKLYQQMGLRIDPNHPNADTIRRKLSITKAKEARGLMTPEEAQQSRAAVAAANERKPRADWGPSPEAQQRMEARNREEDKRYRSR